MKKFILSLLTIFAATASWADTALIVHQKSGGVVNYAFREKPVVTYSEGYLIILLTAGPADAWFREKTT